MKRDGQASSVEYVHLVREFQELVGARIDKVYHSDGFFLLPVYTGSRRTNLVIDVPRVAYLSDNKPSFGRPGGFCMFLRKRLKSGLITAVEQVGFDRILRFAVQTRDADYQLFVELFGKGNLVLCDEEQRIVSAYDNVVYQDRAIRGGVPYELPEPQPDVRELSTGAFADFFGERECVRVLAADVGLGGEYAELVCARAGVDKNAVDVDAEVLREEVLSLLEERAPEHTDECAWPVHVSDDAVSADSFCAAVAAVRDGMFASKKQEVKQEVVEQQQSRFERILTSQEHQIEGFSRAIEQNQRKGELLYEHYSELAQLFYEASRDRKELSEQEFVEKYEQHPLVASAGPLELTLELGEDS